VKRKNITSIFKWLLGIEDKGSRSIAANRMKLMVIHDRHQMPPAVVNQMKKELLDVMAKYFDIDSEKAECIIESRDNRSAFITTNVPLIKKGQADARNTKANQRRYSSSNLSNSLN
jgi:cell division topological specificity factor